MPRPDNMPTAHILQLGVEIEGLDRAVTGLFDGGAEESILSYRTYMSIPSSTRPTLRAAHTKVKGVFSDEHEPVGRITLRFCIPKLKVITDYDVLVDHIEEDIILDNTFMVFSQIDNLYSSKQLRRKGRTVTAISSVTRGTTCRRISLTGSCIVSPRSRQIVPGKVMGRRSHKDGGDGPWMVEPPLSMTSERPVLIGRSLCHTKQVTRQVPVELYNPTDEPIQLFDNTTIGLLSKVDLVADVEPLVVTKSGSNSKVHRILRRTSAGRTLPEELESMVGGAEDHLGTEDLQQFRDLLKQYQDIFSLKGQPLGRTDITLHDIEVGEADPIKCRMRRPPLGLKQEAMEEEERMKKLGAIEPSDSPWASPVVLVRKKDGTLRYCIDYRRLNEITKKDSYPLPNMQDCLESLGGAKHFSTMDLSAGYWQVGMTEAAKDKTSFYGIGGGLWRFNVMPFGLCNAPATFERLMERVLGQLQWQICLCYLDDIMVFSSTVTEHLDHLETIFQRLRAAKLKLKPKKCHFFRKEVTFLGHIVSSEGIATDPAKISKVQDCPAPRDVHEVRSIVGLMSYYRRFIPQFADLARPIIHLTEKGVPFEWGEEQEAAFTELKKRLTTSPVLAYPCSEGQFTLDTDASDCGIGAVLSQLQDGEEKVIAYGSRALSKSERNYCVTRREMLAVVHFTNMYRHFLLGRPFLVRTDNTAVRYWRSMTYQPAGQVARWVEKLQAFDFRAEHRPGKKHCNADGLSRKPFTHCVQCDTRHRGALESKKGPIKVRGVACQTDPPGRESSVSQVSQSSRTRKPRKKRRRRRRNPKEPCDNQQTTERASTQTTTDENSGCEGSQTVPGVRVVPTRQKRPRGQEVEPSSWMDGGVRLDRSLLRDEQQKDPAAVDAMIWYHNGSRPSRQDIMSLGLDHKFLWGNFDSLEIIDGLLVRRIVPRISGHELIHAYVPAPLRREVIRMCHDTVTGGHFYFWKTYSKVKRHFVWPGVSRDVETYCRQCHICATRKTAGRKNRAPMRRYDPGLPMEEIAIDLMGPLPESSKGNKYVLVVVDSFSRWMEAYPIPNMEAKTVAAVLVNEFISRFGVPMWIKSDQGKQFKCELFTQVCDLLQVEHYMSTAFHPQGNSRVERMVKVVGNLLAAFCTTQKEWDEKLPLLTLAYRSTVHEVTGYSPNYVMLGREVMLPLDIMMGTISDDQRRPVLEYVSNLKTQLNVCFTEVREHLKAQGERQRKYYNLSSHGQSFEVGEVVYMVEKTKKIGVSPKLSPKWLGPFIVVQTLGTIYEIQLTPRKSKMVHFDMLKKCYSNPLPTWLQKAQKRVMLAVNAQAP